MKINWHEYWDRYQNYVALFVLAVIAAGCLAFVFAGCSGPYTAAALEARQKAVQNCILSGGHPRLGPDDTILCQ